MKLIILENTKIADMFVVCRIDGNLMVPIKYGNKNDAIYYISCFRKLEIVFKKDRLEFSPGSLDSLATDYIEIPIPQRGPLSRAINKARLS